jgi:hypothetical protein
MNSKQLSWLMTIIALLILPALIGALLQGALTKVIISPFAFLFALSTILPILFFLMDLILEKPLFSNAQIRLHIKLFFYYASFIIPYVCILHYTEEYMSGKISPLVLIWYCIISSFLVSTFLPFISRTRIKEYIFNQLRFYIPVCYLLFSLIAILTRPTYFNSIKLLGVILLAEFGYHCINNVLRKVPAET